MRDLSGRGVSERSSAKFWTAAVLAVVALGVLGVFVARHSDSSNAALFSRPCGNHGSPGVVRHVIWVWMENESYDNVIGNPMTPYQNKLARQCGVATNFHNESHGSLSNYMAATSGESPLATAYTRDCLPRLRANRCIDSGESIFAQAQTLPAGWRGYAESMPSNCSRVDSGTYAARHNPAVYYSSLTECAQFDVPMGDIAGLTGPFYDDARAGNLPSFSFITPNLLDDAHNRSPAVGDAWLKKLITFLTGSASYQNGDTVVFITNDEGCNGRCGRDYVMGEDCAVPAPGAERPSCRVPTIVVAPYTVAGTRDRTFYTHYSMLRTTEELLGLPLLGLARTANSMAPGFNLSPHAATRTH